MPDRFNLAAHLLDRHVNEGRGDRTALIGDGFAWTYSDVFQQANRVGHGLKRLGVEREDRVLLLLLDGPEFVAAFFGALKIGAIAVPTSTALRAADYAYALEESQARVLILHSQLWGQVQPVLGRGGLKHVIVCGEKKAEGLCWRQWLTEQSGELDCAPTAGDDIAFWLWTSGSTGPPKAAVHRHRDSIYCCEYYARGVLGVGPQDLTFSSSKLFHAYGLGNSLLFPFHAGARTVLYPEKPTARAILQKVQEFRPTLFFSVPTLYAAMLHETDAQNPYRLDSVRLGISAAEPLPAEIFRRWLERFRFELLDGLGSTEALHIYVSSRAGQVRPGSSGLPVPGYQVRITDEHGREVAPGQVGDLWVRGESIALCYWNRPELSRQRMQGEWFFTGDKYSADPDGYLWYAGRSDDMFRVSGEWVSPTEVESALIEHPAVLESAVVPYTDENGLLKPQAWVVLKQGWAAGEDLVGELQEFVKQRIAPYKYPRRISFLEELPKTATGKIQRYRLREEAAAA